MNTTTILTVGTKEAKNCFGSVLDRAQQAPVQLTRNGRLVGGIINQSLLEKVLEMQRKEAQKNLLKAMQEIQKEVAKKEKPSRVKMQSLLNCDDEELDQYFDKDFFR